MTAEQFDTAALRSSLHARAAELAISLLGEPSQRTRTELRFGSKGSMSVVIAGDKAGSYFDHERGQGGDMFALIMRVNGMQFRDAAAWAQTWLGARHHEPRPGVAETRSASTTELKRKANASRIWRECIPITGTVAEAYLRRRGIEPPPYIADLRFHPACPTGAGNAWEPREPAMVALMRGIVDNVPTGIHRTFLKPDGSGKTATGKRMLAGFKGSAIKLAADADVTTSLGISEGIENALTWGAFGWWPIWAAGSANAIGTFPVLPGIEALTIFTDADDTGASIANARTCAERWFTTGRGVDIINPPAGADWNDIGREIAA